MKKFEDYRFCEERYKVIADIITKWKNEETNKSNRLYIEAKGYKQGNVHYKLTLLNNNYEEVSVLLDECIKVPREFLFGEVYGFENRLGFADLFDYEKGKYLMFLTPEDKVEKDYECKAMVYLTEEEFWKGAALRKILGSEEIALS